VIFLERSIKFACPKRQSSLNKNTVINPFKTTQIVINYSLVKRGVITSVLAEGPDFGILDGEA